MTTESARIGPCRPLLSSGEPTAYPHAVLFRETRRKYVERVATAFQERGPEGPELIWSCDELVARLVHQLSGRSLPQIPNGLYFGDLLVSFSRSHFAATDLLVGGNLIEFATLLRKQIELVGRIRELVQSDIEALIGRTPNIKHLPENLRRLYGEYSRLAHSSDPESIQLLGHLPHDDGNVYTPVHPEFSSNVYVALNHLGLVAIVFGSTVVDIFATHFADYERADDDALALRIIALLGSGRLTPDAHRGDASPAGREGER